MKMNLPWNIAVWIDSMTHSFEILAKTLSLSLSPVSFRFMNPNIFLAALLGYNLIRDWTFPDCLVELFFLSVLLLTFIWIFELL